MPSAIRASTCGWASSSRRPAAVASRRASRCTAASSANDHTRWLPALSAVDPDIVRRVDHDVGGCRIGQQLGQRTGADEFALQHPDQPQHLGVADQHGGFGAQRLRQGPGSGLQVVVHQPPLHPLEYGIGQLDGPGGHDAARSEFDHGHCCPGQRPPATDRAGQADLEIRANEGSARILAKQRKAEHLREFLGAQPAGRRATDHHPGRRPEVPDPRAHPVGRPASPDIGRCDQHRQVGLLQDPVGHRAGVARQIDDGHVARPASRVEDDIEDIGDDVGRRRCGPDTTPRPGRRPLRLLAAPDAVRRPAAVRRERPDRPSAARSRVSMPSMTSRPAPHGSQSTRNTSADGTSFWPRAAAQATAAGEHRRTGTTAGAENGHTATVTASAARRRRTTPRSAPPANGRAARSGRRPAARTVPTDRDLVRQRRSSPRPDRRECADPDRRGDQSGVDQDDRCRTPRGA